MSRLPPLSLFRKEDYPEAPTWFTRAIFVFNSFFEKIYNVLNGNIDFTNLDMAIESVTVTNSVDIGTGTNGYSFRNRIKRAPEALMLGSVQVANASTDTELTAGTHINWTYDGEYIKIQSIVGLSADTKYNIKLILM